MKPYYSDEFVTLYHGDCFEVLHDLSGLGAVVTDPPYSSGGQFRGDRAMSTVAKYVNSDTQRYSAEFAGDTRDQRSFLAWCSLWMAAARAACVPSAPIVAFTDWRQLPTTTDAVQAAGWVWRGIGVWSKGYGRPKPGQFSGSCEFTVFGSNGPTAEHAVYPPGIVECSIVREREHIAEKPEAVMAWALGTVPEGAVVLDPFLGSGTTLVAAKLRGLRGVGIEIDERYCEIAAKRLAQGVLWGAG